MVISLVVDPYGRVDGPKIGPVLIYAIPIYAIPIYAIPGFDVITLYSSAVVLSFLLLMFVNCCILSAGRGSYNGRPAYRIDEDSIVNVFGGFK